MSGVQGPTFPRDTVPKQRPIHAKHRGNTLTNTCDTFRYFAAACLAKGGPDIAVYTPRRAARTIRALGDSRNASTTISYTDAGMSQTGERHEDLYQLEW
ncbi:MAG TPA: hypothetical protein HPP83_04835 [Candidatus Hydrogenedentes bacterium]|nr:hypothetical protein [Candidatus Hydrogenedentota bacterium]